MDNFFTKIRITSKPKKANLPNSCVPCFKYKLTLFWKSLLDKFNLICFVNVQS